MNTLETTPINQTALNVATLRHYILPVGDTTITQAEAMAALQDLAMALGARQTWWMAAFIAGGLFGVIATMIAIIAASGHP